MVENKTIESHTYESSEEVRIEAFARQSIHSIQTNKGIKKAILRGQIVVNKKEVQTSYWMKKGDILELIDAHKPSTVYEFSVKLAFEDDLLAVVEKPSGLSIHNNQLKNLINCLDFNLKESSHSDALLKMHPIHRLDQQTSGLIIIAKTYKSQENLSTQLREGDIKKTYSAIVHGQIHKNMLIDSPIDGKSAQTEILEHQEFGSENEDFSLLKIELKTGRTHQIRIHLSGLSHPIVGDRLYGDTNRLIKGRGLMLAANGLSFLHPITHEIISLEIPLPKKFDKFIFTKSK